MVGRAGGSTPTLCSQVEEHPPAVSGPQVPAVDGTEEDPALCHLQTLIKRHSCRAEHMRTAEPPGQAGCSPQPEDPRAEPDAWGVHGLGGKYRWSQARGTVMTKAWWEAVGAQV